MRLLDWLPWRPRQRAGPPLDVVPSYSRWFGPGVQAQPAHGTLLQESVGIPDAAARAIANRLGSLTPQVKVTRRIADGTEEDEILDDHPLADLLARPHPNLSRFQLLRLTGQWIVTVGEAYWLKVGNGFRVPVELHPIPPTMVEPLVRDNIVAGYLVTDANGKRMERQPSDFVRFFFPDPESPWRSEGYLGPSGITADSHKFAGQHLRAHYQHDATPRVVMEAGENAEPFEEAERQRFYTLWREYYSSRSGSRSGLPAMGPTGWKFVELAMQTGADMTPLLEYWRDDLLMEYGVPRSVLGQVVSGDRSSAETNQWVFDRYAVLPIANLISDALTLQLASDFDAQLQVCFEPFVSEDKDHLLKQEAQDLTQMVTSVNEVRAARGFDPVPWGEQPIGTTADVPYDPAAAAERANRPPQPPPVAPKEEMPEMADDEGDDEDDERQAHIALRQRYRAKRRAEREQQQASRVRKTVKRDDHGRIAEVIEERVA